MRTGSSRRSAGAIALIAAVVLSAGIAACGDDEEEGSKAQTLAVSVDAQNKLQGVKAVESGAVQIDFENQAKLDYGIQLIKVDGNQTAADVEKALESGEQEGFPPWLHGAGGNGGTKAGKSSTSTQVLEEGNYFVIAMVDGEGGSKPILAALKVQGGEGGGELPSTDATVTALDYSFQTSGLKPGKNTIVFDNTGKEPHHVVAAPISPGKTLADVKKFATSDNQNVRPPIEFEQVTSTAVLDGGTKQVTQLNLKKPGNYALLCFITDRRGGPPHVAKGMVTEVKVG